MSDPEFFAQYLQESFDELKTCTGKEEGWPPIKF